MEPSQPPPTRRSQPNLTHPTLHPLTSTLPAPTHSTSRSTSYLSPSSLPPLSRSILSRSSSRTRQRPLHPRPIPTSSSSPALPNAATKSRSKKSAAAMIDDEGWLLRTASRLAGQSMEEKGQAWLATRESSTSLSNSLAGMGDLDADDEYDAYSPEFSRSRMNSRRGSLFSEGPQGVGEVGPDFVDLVEEEEEEGERKEEEQIDEGEMRRVVMGRFGGWVDWAVGWMDFRDLGDGGEEGDEDDEGKSGEGVEEAPVVGPVDRGVIVEGLQRRDEKGAGVMAPEGDVGVLKDVKWLLDVAAKIVL